MLALITAIFTALFPSVADFYADSLATAARIDSIVAATPADSLPELLQQVDERHFEPASQEYNEGLCALWLRAAMPRLEDTDLEVAQWKLHEVCELNAEGTPAADFEFEPAMGPRRVALSRYLPGKPLLIIFYDPICHSCEEGIRRLREANVAARINVLAVCINPDHNLWLKSRDTLPQGWMRAFDLSDVYNRDTYMLRALPAIYLLDAKRNVLLKNATPQRVINTLE